MIPETMFGVQLVGHGGPEQLVWRNDLPTPQPKAGEVLVRVSAAGVNNTDINTRLGWYAKTVTAATNAVSGEINADGAWGGALQFPRIQGGDLCGEVVALGDGVSSPEIGKRVTCALNQPIKKSGAPVYFEALGSERDGAFAQYCCVSADQLFDVSESPLTDIEIGAMPCAYGTALNLLTRSQVNDDDRVLVTGASGGVGLATVQLACQKGARVTAIAAAPKADAVLAAGAQRVLDRDASLPKEDFTVVIDVVGGNQFGKFLDALCPGGRLATSGAIAGPMAEVDLRTLYLKDLTVFGCTYQSREVFRALVSLINSGSLRPLVSKVYPLKDIAQAQTDFMTKRYPGKLVLRPFF